VPFDAPNVHELIRLHLLEVPPPLARWRPDVPAAIEQLVTRMLAKTPHYRPTTATEAVDLFEEVVRALPQAEREREIPVKLPQAEQAKQAFSTRPLLNQPLRKPNKATSRRTEARPAATFTNVRETKQLTSHAPRTVPPLPSAPPVAKSVKPTTAAPALSTKPAAKSAVRAKATPAKAIPARYNAKTLLLIGLAVLLLAAVAAYFVIQRKPQVANRRVIAANTNYSASQLPDFRSDLRREP
jgi:hypothetical protein